MTTPATLHDIAAAIYAAVTALQSSPPTSSTPFAWASWWAGEFLAEQAPQVMTYPCALVAPLGERGKADAWPLQQDFEMVGEDRFTVFVGVNDPRGDGSAILGDSTWPTSGSPGAMRLIDAVIGAVNKLLVAGLYQGGAVMFDSWTPHWIRRGVAYVYAVRFVVKRVTPEATFPDPSADLTDFQGGVQLPPYGTDTPPATPIDFNPNT